MGGNALNNLAVTRRYSAKEYYELGAEVFDKLYEDNHKLVAYQINAFKDKESFGDMDVIINSPTDLDMINRVFGPAVHVKNGNVVSFPYKEFQLDFIFIQDYQTALFAQKYYSYNDLGNLLGRTSHRLGFKFGHDGLWYVLRDKNNPTHIVKEILVTQDFCRALTFLGFDPNTHLNGFKTLTQIFEYAASSEYFDPKVFLLANRNHIARVRDRKRPNYNLAVEYYKNKYSLTDDMEYDRLPDHEKEAHLQRAFQFFKDENFKDRFNQALDEYDRVIQFKNKINGDNYSKWFDVSGVELGQLLSKHKKYLELHQLMDYIRHSPVELVEQFVKAIEQFDMR